MPRRGRFEDDDDDDRRRRHYDGDDVDSRPRRRGGDFPIWILLALGGGVIGLVLLATLGYFLLRPARTPQAPTTDEGPIANVGAFPQLNHGIGGQVVADRIIRLRANASPQQLIFGGGHDGYIGIMSFAQGGYEVEVFNTATG